MAFQRAAFQGYVLPQHGSCWCHSHDARAVLGFPFHANGGGESRQGFQIPLKIDICGATAEGEGSPRQLPGNFPDNAVADLCFCHKLLISLRINSGKASDALSRHASQLC
ncbi:conserved hypothetical protein [Brucella melitensis bv. 1 str. Rev.1]|nr:conserved hypothetical protein [Brucella melitensis bv. 1 str. Rev.1]